MEHTTIYGLYGIHGIYSHGMFNLLVTLLLEYHFVGVGVSFLALGNWHIFHNFNFTISQYNTKTIGIISYQTLPCTQIPGDSIRFKAIVIYLPEGFTAIYRLECL